MKNKIKLVGLHTEYLNTANWELESIAEVKKTITEQYFRHGPIISYTIDGVEVNDEDYVDKDYLKKLVEEDETDYMYREYINQEDKTEPSDEELEDMMAED